MLLGHELKCAVCGELICHYVKGKLVWEDSPSNIKKTNLNLSNGTYTTITSHKNCIVKEEDFGKITQFLRDGWVNEMDHVAGWTDARKAEYKFIMCKLSVVGFRS